MPQQKSTNTPVMKPPKKGVTIRMYNPGFGDCFLLAFRAENNQTRYMLIDCGVHHQYPNREEIMKKIVRDIGMVTDNHLHVVVVTHEHTDHLYGFKYGRKFFDDIKIDDLWLAWTEDPNDPLANQLKQLYGIRIKALNAAVNQLRLAKDPLANAIQRLLDFEYPDAFTATTGGKSAQLEYLRTKSMKKLQRKQDYRSPEEAPLTLPGVKGVKIYVLGPPRNIEWIKKLEEKSELYPELTAMNEISAFTVAALAAEKSDSFEVEGMQFIKLNRPFTKPFEIPKDDARRHSEYGQFFQRHYGFSKERGHAPEWRRIETDWLAMAEQLALDIHNKTNNTSLVFAIELTETQPHKTLLFTADAQVGNWLSWHQLFWQADDPEDEPVTFGDLLRRTVLYKVGHHGSRNATLKRKGLEMMESDNLVAMLPVDQEWANTKMNWEHPAEKLLERLQEKTRGRVIRTDEIPSGGKPLKKPDIATENEWNAFIKNLDWDHSQDKLWIQYTLE